MFKRKKLTLGQQVIGMNKYFPSFELTWKKSIATWNGYIKPTSISENYLVKIQYSLEGNPGVWVVSPELAHRSDKEKIPHIYPGKKLCLYLPGTGEWHKNLLIAETIVPWASLWLYYYELWHVTGNWLGGGVHPNRRIPRN